MSPLAKILVDMGHEVSGSDIKENLYTLKLKEMGATLFYGHHESNIRVCDIVVVSTAIREDNIELKAAQNVGIPILRRAELLSFIMDQHQNRIAVSGTHGKTTVSSFLAHYLTHIGQRPSYVIGATLKRTQTSAAFGNPEYCVAEADESDRSFLFLNPTIVVITNVEEEHLDEYKDLPDILATFDKLVTRTPEKKGLLILCGDDPNIHKLHTMGREVITYGTKEGNDIRAINIRNQDHRLNFDVQIDGKKVASDVSLFIPGVHNILNSLTVFALAKYKGFNYDRVVESFRDFEGASRRFHWVGGLNGLDVYDDYAHHPTEITCVLEAAKTYNRRVVAIFQPHRYSRFSAFFERFVSALELADIVICTDIYAAGETNSSGLTTHDLVKRMDPKRAYYVKNIGGIAPEVLKLLKKGDLVITLGAGDITHVAREIVQLMKSKANPDVLSIA
jgi:UDP-N-acetylmuramate--alanine ligase